MTNPAWCFYLHGKTAMSKVIDPGFDKVRTSTAADVNSDIDETTRKNILWYSREDPDVIAARMAELDNEWDIERYLQLNAAFLAMLGGTLGATRNRLWYIVPGLVSFFLGQHAIQGWCPPVELFRRMGIRTRKEIDMEKYSLMEALKSKQR